MTIEASSGKAGRFGRRRTSPGADGLAIGEIDANIFNCPACARPLGIGTPRCPGCSTRLVAGVTMGKAASFVVVGLSFGMLIGGGSVALAASMNRPSTVVAAEPPPIVVPSQVPVASAVAPPVIDPTVPSAASSALRQSAVVNQRIVADAARLTAALDAARPSATDIAPILRGLASTAGFGDRVAPDIADWGEGATLSQALVTFYAAIGGAADDGLAASLSNDRAYVDAGRRMMAILGGLIDLDAAARTLAADADVDLPPLDPAAP